MANLEKIAESLNVKLVEYTKKQPAYESTEKTVGHKRRAWLLEENTDEEKGSINPFNEEVLKGSINPVDQPLLLKGSIKGVYKPLLISLLNLRGNPLQIIQYIFERLRKKKEKITDKTTQSEIMKNLEISKDSAKTAMRFLLKNELLERVEFQAGKMGWSRYKIKNELYEELEKAYQKGSINPFNQKGSNNSSSIYITTTIKDRPLLDWDNVDVSPLEHIGLTHKHLLQLKNNHPDIVQESINHFAYGIKYNPKVKKYDEPLSVLIGVLRKGEAWVEVNYKSPVELAQQELVERRKSEKERLIKLQEEAYKLAFDEWMTSLVNDDIEKILSNTKKNGDITPQKVRLNAYFRENVWVNRKNEYLAIT